MSQNDLLKFSRWVALLSLLVIVAFTLFLIFITNPSLLRESVIKTQVAVNPTDTLWNAPDTLSLPTNEQGKLIRYGRELIAHTANYLGPNGSVKKISNGMNCQNCHLQAGTKPFGNNYASVASTYPKFRARSGSVGSIEKRVNDCFERSLNGSALDSLSHEMQALVAYIKWLGKGVATGKMANGSGLFKLAYLTRAADSAKGKLAYAKKCITCHGKNGEGAKKASQREYLYPPVWGNNSFTTAAGLYRISNFAKYIYANMPLGATFYEPQLTDEEAWDIAAYVVSMDRPVKTFPNDWPKVASKPIDYPFGPYADNLTERRHKYGPFQ